jgi:hypothetical protein
LRGSIFLNSDAHVPETIIRAAFSSGDNAMIHLLLSIDVTHRISYPLAKKLEVEYDTILGTRRMVARRWNG